MRLACLAVVVSLLMAASASAAPRAGASGRNYKKVCGAVATGLVRCHAELVTDASGNPLVTPAPAGYGPDRKSTRLNSSHMSISYAVFCLKKKKTKILSFFLKKKKKTEKKKKKK